jgi:hypothetical protein
MRVRYSMILLIMPLALPLWVGSVWGQDDCFSEPFFPFGRPHDYVENIQPIFDEHCVACHSPGGEGYNATGLDLRPEHSYANLVWTPSSQDPNRLLVDPNSVDDSLLWHKINCDEPGVGVRMPKDQPRLPFQTDQLAIRTWLVRGAAGPDGVTPPEPPREEAINVGMSGSWYDPNKPGQGFVFDVVIDREPPLFVVYWFTYSNESGGPEEQRWYMADGEYQEGDHAVSLNLFQVVGGRFDESEPATNLDTVGSIVLEFETCNKATFSYLFESGEMAGDSGEIVIERLSPDVFCESLTNGDDQ